MKIIIVGGGQTGTHVSKLLLEEGHDIKIIEEDDYNFEKLEEKFSEDLLLHGSGADPELLEKAGIMEADILVAVTGSDETNLVTSTLAKMEFGVSKVVARINHPKNEWLFTREMGVDYPFNQVRRIAKKLVDEIV